MSNGQSSTGVLATLPKAPTGISGLDEITRGGLPRGRPTLVCGSAGSGKTLLSMEFLVRGATAYDEPGVFIAFEETADELTQNVASLGFDLQSLIDQKKLAIDYVYIDRSEIEETGEYDLEALFVRLDYAINSIGAKRVVIDTIEVLFTALSDSFAIRSELRRLFRWLKDKGVTAIITGERGNGNLTRHGLEEYISDCVILLDNRVTDQLAMRRLRVVKYRGSAHGPNEYPFLIDDQGLSVMPITSIGLQHTVSEERISTGVEQLDNILGGQGYFRSSTVLVSGTAGSGKSSLAAHFVDAACRRGERCLYFASEELPNQIIRNMRSIGLNLEPWVKQGLLRYHAVRPTLYGLEMHLAVMHKLVTQFQPQVLVVDPITNFTAVGDYADVKAMLTRLIDFLKSINITTLLTSLTTGGEHPEQTEVGISSLVDTWLLLRDLEMNGERNRGLYVLKSRGMAHSNQIREFLLTNQGVQLIDVYVGPGGVLTGSSRVSHEAQERAAALVRQQDSERKRRALERKRKALQAQIDSLWAEYEAEVEEIDQLIAQEQQREERLEDDRAALARSRNTQR